MPPSTGAPPVPPRAFASAAAVLLALPLFFGCGGDDRREAGGETGPADEVGGVLTPLPPPPDTPLPEGAEGWSFLGLPLYPPPLPLEIRSLREENLEVAIRDLADDPDDPERWIWVGRHHAYLGDYREAIRVFTEGLERFPEDMRFLRHRGHRWITLRELDRARDDLTRAVAGMGEAGGVIEPDGLPNPAGIPLTTLAFNAWYHLALAHTVAGDLPAAREAWEATLAVSDNADLQAATRYWLHLVLRRLGEEAEAARVAAGVSAADELLENVTYRDLLLHFRGEIPEEAVLPAGSEGLASVTALYGLGAHALLQGDTVEARRRFQEILDRADQWPAFGFVAAEAEVRRLGR